MSDSRSGLAISLVALIQSVLVLPLSESIYRFRHVYDHGSDPPAQIETVFKWGKEEEDEEEEEEDDDDDGVLSDSFCKTVTNAVMTSGKEPSCAQWKETKQMRRKWGSCLITASN